MSVRVRYQVPADGRLNLTTARTAFYGWLYARHEAGGFFLREAEGTLSSAVASFLDGLRLLGLDWDRESDGDRPGTVHVFCDACLPTRDPSDAESPQYVCLPPIKEPGASIEVRELVRQGYSGLALANCLARLGWSPRGKRALLTLDELAARFELGCVSHRPVVFDRRHLDWFNRRWLSGLDAGEVSALLVPHWHAAYGCAERAVGTALSPEAWRQMLALAIREGLDRPEQCVDKARFAFIDDLPLDPASRTALDQPYAETILRAFARELPPASSPSAYDFEPLDEFCREFRLRFKDTLGVRSRDVMYVLRAALTGRQDGPCLVVVCQLLGRARCIQRVQAALGET
jgi:glutamyl/glutaminyl-tRNA synthetase